MTPHATFVRCKKRRSAFFHVPLPRFHISSSSSSSEHLGYQTPPSPPHQASKAPLSLVLWTVEPYAVRLLHHPSLPLGQHGVDQHLPRGEACGQPALNTASVLHSLHGCHSHARPPVVLALTAAAMPRAAPCVLPVPWVRSCLADRLITARRSAAADPPPPPPPVTSLSQRLLCLPMATPLDNASMIASAMRKVPQNPPFDADEVFPDPAGYEEEDDEPDEDAIGGPAAARRQEGGQDGQQGDAMLMAAAAAEVPLLTAVKGLPPPDMQAPLGQHACQGGSPRAGASGGAVAQQHQGRGAHSPRPAGGAQRHAASVSPGGGGGRGGRDVRGGSASAAAAGAGHRQWPASFS